MIKERRSSLLTRYFDQLSSTTEGLSPLYAGDESDRASFRATTYNHLGSSYNGFSNTGCSIIEAGCVSPLFGRQNLKIASNTQLINLKQVETAKSTLNRRSEVRPRVNAQLPDAALVLEASHTSAWHVRNGGDEQVSLSLVYAARKYYQRKLRCLTAKAICSASVLNRSKSGFFPSSSQAF
ncbi:hypothetical protein PM082_021656 [Marasmius tenuissimus]|nr:hypothetical protein PM082_021656 [Marasmius tenuissimus]